MPYKRVILPPRPIMTRKLWGQILENLRTIACHVQAVGPNEIAIGEGVDVPGFTGLPTYGTDDTMIIGRNNNLVRHISDPQEDGRYILAVANNGEPEWQTEDIITGRNTGQILTFVGL